MASSEAVIRKCVHCGFCTATCPTYLLLGDELDSPRGRIYLIKEMLENERQPSPEVVQHFDHCLSCLSCMTTCPSDVNYMHLIDHARAYIEARYKRPFRDRLIRRLLAHLLPHPRRFRLALSMARLARWAGLIAAKVKGLEPFAAMLALAPRAIPRRATDADAWIREIEGDGLDAILVTASGCGTTIKDYGFILRDDPAYAEKAARVSALAQDVSEFLAGTTLQASAPQVVVVAYQAACSLQHGQKVTDAPRRLLAEAGYIVKTPADAHLCCGSAGTYNVLQPAIADQFGERKVANLATLEAKVIATGNIGCATHIGQRTGTPVVHIVELLDWATGGPAPEALKKARPRQTT